MFSRSIGIIGCGWLGKPLADALLDDFEVRCFSREDTTDNSLFWQSDTIIIAINTKDNYLKTIKKIAKLSNSLSNIILMSSISVYREFDDEVDEKATIKKVGIQKEAEELLLSLKSKVLILRLGGLMGEDRVSGKWKKISIFSDGEVNYIHRYDAINITKKMIENKITNGIYNLVAPIHPLRSQVHANNSKKFGFNLGTFKGITHRIVSSNAVIEKLDYNFKYPNPLNFWD